jgi:integrase
MRNVFKKIATDGKISYLIRVSEGYSSNGKQTRKSMTYKPSPNMTQKQIDKELERQAIKFEEKVRSGYCIDENVRFENYSKNWLKINKPNFAPMTYARYENLLIRINQAIGHIKIGKIQSMHLKEFYKNLGEVISRQTKQPLSQQTIKHYHRCISVILATATKEQVISRNVASRSYMDSPKIDKKEPLHMDTEHARKFVELLMAEDDIRVKTALSVLLYSGVRMGELCGMEWSDIDFKNNIISIKRTSQYCTGYGMITKEPKNETSKRTIKLSPEVFKILSQYKAWYNQQKLMNGNRWINSNRLFIQEKGKAIQPATINLWLDKFITVNNLPKLTPHSLRHTFCTLLIANGVDIKTVSAKAGHSRASTTLDIYTHTVKEADELASQVLDDILTPKKFKKG